MANYYVAIDADISQAKEYTDKNDVFCKKYLFPKPHPK